MGIGGLDVPLKDWRFIGCTAGYEDARVVLFGAPFDGTVSYRPGARFGPQAMRAESFGIETYSPYQRADLEDAAVCDAGDIDIPIGNTAGSLEMVRRLAARILSDGRKPLMLGGEHLVSSAAILAAAEKYPGLAVLHFDAHADLREDYLGEKLSHASAMRRVHDALGDGAVWQFGIRSGTAEEFAWAARGHTRLFPFTLRDVPAAIEEIGGRPAYVTVDLDVLDPSVFPGTGTPEAGGVTFSELVDALLALKSLHLVGADAVELAPNWDPSGVSTATACKAVRELALLLSHRL